MVLTKKSSPFYPWSHLILSHPSFILKPLSFPNNQGHDKVVSALSLSHQMQPDQSQSPGVPWHVNWGVFTVFGKVEDNFQVYRWLARYIYSGHGGYVRACDAREWCHWGTDTHTAVRTRGRWHGERTLKVPRRHGASTLNVPSLWDFLRAIHCVGGTAAARDMRCRYGCRRITFRPQSAAGDAEFQT